MALELEREQGSPQAGSSPGPNSPVTEPWRPISPSTSESGVTCHSSSSSPAPSNATLTPSTTSSPTHPYTSSPCPSVSPQPLNLSPSNFKSVPLLLPHAPLLVPPFLVPHNPLLIPPGHHPHPHPITTSPHRPPQIPSRHLAFSIENILKPDFGHTTTTTTTTSPPERRREHSTKHTTKDTPKLQPAQKKPVDLRKAPDVDPIKLANPTLPDSESPWPAWVFCTRYSDRPSSGPRSRRMKKKDRAPEEKRPRTAFTSEQLGRLKREFEENRYLTEKRRQDLAKDLGLNESQIKIWFQNKRAKIKKSTGQRGGLALHLMAQGLYNHSTVPVDEDDQIIESH